MVAQPPGARPQGAQIDRFRRHKYNWRMLSWSRVRERVAVDLLRWTPKGTLSRGIGWVAQRRVPRPLRRAVYGGFARYVGADLSALDRPIENFERFDEFFTRPLRPGAR